MRSKTRRSPDELSSPGFADFDQQLIAEAERDPDAIATLYRRHVHAVYAHAYRLSRSTEVAEEATSATFEHAIRALPKFQWEGGGVRSWLLRIASNEVAGVYRRQGRDSLHWAQLAMREMAVEETEPDDRDDEVLAAIAAALPRLPESYRKVIELRYLSNVSTASTAAALGCSKANIAVTLHRALGALKREMAVDTSDQGGFS